MKKEISKGTQKFIWHMVAFIAVFILVLVILCRVLPEPNRTAIAGQSTQITASQTENNQSTDFDSVKERVDEANNTTGKEVRSIYSGDGKSTMQKQLETRLFFNTLKSILICALLVVVIIVLLKKGFNFKKISKILDEEDEASDDDVADETGKTEDAPKETPIKDASDEESIDTEHEPDRDSGDDEKEPPIVDPAEPDEQEVAENCKL